MHQKENTKPVFYKYVHVYAGNAFDPPRADGLIKDLVIAPSRGGNQESSLVGSLLES